MSRRHTKGEQDKTPLRTLLITGIVAIVTLVITLAVCISGFKSKHQFREANEEYAELVDDYDNLKPNVSDIVTGKFDLQSRENELSKNYTILTKALFGDARSTSAINEHEEQYSKYFGQSGYKKIRRIAINNSSQLIANHNTETKVMFSDFDLENKQIKVVIYSQFNLKSNMSDNKYGIVYITSTYDFNKDQAIKCTVQNATFSSDDD